MFRVENIESPRSGRPVANQFKVVMDTAVGRVVLFQSYATPIAMLINCPIHGTAYYIATDEYFSVTTSKYQKMLSSTYGYPVSSFKAKLFTRILFNKPN